jgi:hypothetical protein
MSNIKFIELYAIGHSRTCPLQGPMRVRWGGIDMYNNVQKCP